LEADMSISDAGNGGKLRLSDLGTRRFAVATAVSFSAVSSAPTPLYHLYQEILGLSPLAVTLVFASYAFAMVAAFLTVARLSDYVGRRPMILVALVLNGAALALFIEAHAAGMLIAARVVQGVATGIGMTTLGALILDADRRNGAVYNSVTAFLGLMVGTLLSGVLVSFAPLPTQLVYMVLFAATVLQLLALAVVPETNSGKPGALGALVPNLAVPASALPTLLRLTPLNLAGWALGGYYFSLMPSLVTVATGQTSLFVGAGVVSALVLTASIVVFALRGLPAARLLTIGNAGLAAGIVVTLIGVDAQSAALMLAGTVIAGVGFGAAYSGILRAILPLAGEKERAGLLAAYFTKSYLAFALPAILAGLYAPRLGLVTTSYAYGAALLALILVSFAVLRPRRPARMMEI
jgi:MFS family permease